ncbi:MAG: ParA family protein [Planctomycetaceae bacterium]|jgi:cellulose biosynthesis protein BcsQ|nr:ParA family protein [Planctomycetaceae bacterium]
MKKKIEFGDVLDKVADLLIKLLPDNILKDETVVVRDIYNRILILLKFDKNRKKEKQQLINDIENALKELGPYYRGESSVLCACDLYESDIWFKNQDILTFRRNDVEIKLLERQITGQDWLRPKTELHTIPRLAFYSFKGGVGRSTTVAAIAFLLAQSGKKVLVFDFDLESPGLASMLLPIENQPKYGIVDWLVEDSVDNVENHLLQDMAASSRLATNMDGNIKVIPAMGAKTDGERIDPCYLAKLSRIYADIPKQDGRIERFSDRLERLVIESEKSEKPDVVLIDCRAGLHDLSAGSIVRIADESFLFIVDTPQSWQGYRLLFSHWQQFPKEADIIRRNLKVVHALIPPKGHREKPFLDESYRLFQEILYDTISSGDTSQDEKIFWFDRNIEEAPHFPIGILWDEFLSEFDYHKFDNSDTQQKIKSNYDSLFKTVTKILEK